MKSKALALSILTAVTVLFAIAAVDRPAVGASAPAGLSETQLADGNQRFNVSGTVAAVDYASNTVTVKTGGQTVQVIVTPTTVIEEHGEAGSIADIRKGAKITASGVVRNGQKVALSINLK